MTQHEATSFRWFLLSFEKGWRNLVLQLNIHSPSKVGPVLEGCSYEPGMSLFAVVAWDICISSARVRACIFFMILAR